MDEAAITARLDALGLRLAPSERPAFAVLIADMESASAIAAQPLQPVEEPAAVLRLTPAR
ncbi:hypothetical protein [Acidisphaera sp. L21]|uniref:hypothetical protein n=1 Tax=Acidisphaera sp. L21 TaxID=1641851 RepID=UPI00131E53FB|nr:hypothetical protein [Acidisphaera sp. L21]